MKTKSRREIVLQLLSKPGTKMTCQELTKRIIKKQKLTGSVAHYLSGSISSILLKLVKDKVVKRAKEKGPLGGSVYQMK